MSKKKSDLVAQLKQLESVHNQLDSFFNSSDVDAQRVIRDQMNKILGFMSDLKTKINATKPQE